MRVVVLASVAVAALLLLGGAGAGCYLAGQAQVDETVRAVNRDLDDLNASLAGMDQITKSQPGYPDFSQSSSPQAFIGSARQFDSAADQALAGVGRIGAGVQRGRGVLADARRRLARAAGSWLTLGGRSRLDDARRRTGFEQQALALAAQMVEAAQRQLHSARSAIDGLAAYAGMIEELQAGDYTGSLAAYSGVHGLFFQAGTYANGAHLGPVWDTLLADLNKLADDTRAGVQAVQNGDGATAQAKAAALDADSKALDGLDTSSLNRSAYLEGLLSQIQALEARTR